MFDAFAGASLIFLLRLGDVPIGTLRTMLMVQGRKLPVAFLAVCESAIWVLAIGRVLADGLDSPWKVIGYSMGFATGTVVGMILEGWLAFGKVLVRVISSKSKELRTKLLEANFGLTAVRAENKSGEVFLLFIVLRRRRKRELLRCIQAIDPDAFITVEPIGEAHGGFVEPPMTSASP